MPRLFKAAQTLRDATRILRILGASTMVGFAISAASSPKLKANRKPQTSTVRVPFRESGLFDTEQKERRKVSKAFLITGGTEDARQKKYSELYRGDVVMMYDVYEGTDELAVIFSAHHSDLGLTQNPWKQSDF